MAITLFTGDILSFLAVVTATGAIINTVATLSISRYNSGKSAKAIIAHFTLGTRLMIWSANNEHFRFYKEVYYTHGAGNHKNNIQSTVAITLLIGKIPPFLRNLLYLIDLLRGHYFLFFIILYIPA